MTTAVAFPDAPAVVASYVRAELARRADAAHVGTKVPAPRPARLVFIHRGGGTVENRIVDAAQLNFECFDTEPGDAMALAQIVRGLVLALAGKIIDGAVFYRTDEIGGPGELPDPVSNLPRVVFTEQVRIRGTAL